MMLLAIKLKLLRRLQTLVTKREKQMLQACSLETFGNTQFILKENHHNSIF